MTLRCPTMAVPRCAATGCRMGVAPGSRWCGPRGRDHLDLARRAKELGIRWTGALHLTLARETRHGLQLRRPGHPAASERGWMYLAVVEALDGGTPVCGWCSWSLEGEPREWEVRGGRVWCGACGWAVERRRSA